MSDALNTFKLRGGNSVKVVLLPFWKRVFPKRENQLPLGTTIILFYREDPISEGDGYAENQRGSHKYCLLFEKVEIY